MQSALILYYVTIVDAMTLIKCTCVMQKTITGKGKFSIKIIVPETVLTTTVIISVLAQTKYNERLVNYRTLKYRKGSRYVEMYPPPKN